MPDLLDRPVTTPEEGSAEAQHVKKQRIHGRLPEKRSINLATVNVKRINWALAVPLLLLTLLAIGAFAKFGVLDQLAAAEQARAEVDSLRRELDAGYAAIDDFGEINDIYAHYTYSGMTQEELSRADRVAMMEMLARVVLPHSPVDSWTVSGNELVLNISGSTLQEINHIVQNLLEDDMVDYCTVTTAATSQRPSEPPPGRAAEPETVSANVVVQLKSTEREVAK